MIKSGIPWIGIVSNKKALSTLLIYIYVISNVLKA